MGLADGLKLLESYGEFFKLMAMGRYTRYLVTPSTLHSLCGSSNPVVFIPASITY